jgi:D-3-phosphoglycerate dehydrogenase
MKLTLFPGISVSNTPNINIYAVADLTIYLMIGALRHTTSAERALVRGIFPPHLKIQFNT